MSNLEAAVAEVVESVRCMCGHSLLEHDPERGCITQPALCGCTSYRMDVASLIRQVSRAAYTDALRMAGEMLMDLAARLEVRMNDDHSWEEELRRGRDG